MYSDKYLTARSLNKSILYLPSLSPPVKFWHKFHCKLFHKKYFEIECKYIFIPSDTLNKFRCVILFIQDKRIYHKQFVIKAKHRIISSSCYNTNLDFSQSFLLVCICYILRNGYSNKGCY